MTGLFNRREFNEQLEHDWRACQRDHEQLAILMMDIDHFKFYNDSYEHQEGDRCLQLVAGAIREQLKRGRDLVARYGDEEFVCLLPQTNAQAAQRIGEKIMAAVQALIIPHTSSLTAKNSHPLNIAVLKGVTVLGVCCFLWPPSNNLLPFTS